MSTSLPTYYLAVCGEVDQSLHSTEEAAEASLRAMLIERYNYITDGDEGDKGSSVSVEMCLNDLIKWFIKDEDGDAYVTSIALLD